MSVSPQDTARTAAQNIARAAARPKRAPLKQLACPNCSKPINQFAPDSQTLVCPSCGSHVAIGVDEAQLMGKGSRLPSADVPIQIGDTAKLRGAEYIVLGRVLYEGWDDEDSWRWNEWQLGSADGRLLWLSYDEKGFSLFNKLRIKQPFNPQIDPRFPVGMGEDGKPKMVAVHERYPARIVGAQGELTWRAASGDKLYMAEGAANRKRYSVQHTSEELEVYEGDGIPELEMAQAFGNEKWVTEVKNRVSTAGLMSWLGGLCVLFGIGSLLVAAWAVNTGEIVLKESAVLSAANPTITYVVDLNQAERPAVVTVKARTAIPLNTSADVDVDIEGPDESETELFTLEFWNESGYDEGEYWEESQTEATQMFVPFQTGPHDLVISLGETLAIDTVSLELIVRRNHILPLWFVVYGLAIGAVGGGILFFTMASSKE